MDSLRIFDTYLYEISKGTKPAALVTVEASLLDKIVYRLEKLNIAYLIQHVECDKVNVFFGGRECIETLKTFLKPLGELNIYEDFILGAILGYDTKLQCERFLKRIKK